MGIRGEQKKEIIRINAYKNIEKQKLNLKETQRALKKIKK
jgi:hypothetical protein